MKYSLIIQNKNRRAIAIPIIIVLFGQLFFYPVENDLKISAGVIAMGIILLIEKEISPLFIGVSSGTAVVALRTIVDIFIGELDFKLALLGNLPALLFYSLFGFFAGSILKPYKNNFFGNLLVFTLIDFISNICESLVRRDINASVLTLIFLTAIIRSLVTCTIYQLYLGQTLFILNEQHQSRYAQLNLMLSNIDAELFYLKKSVLDINNVMSQSYSLYENLKETTPELSKQALNISREVHEIRKDYDRVLKGFECLIDDVERQDAISLRDIFSIISNNINHVLKENDKNVKVNFNCNTNLMIDNYYKIFAILNNLIVNAIDASSGFGIIKVSANPLEGELMMIVEDNGEGIEPDILPYIFNPGFTTKFDEITGKGSTGIGLCHVKNIVEDLGGSIDVSSIVSSGTKFIIILPIKSL